MLRWDGRAWRTEALPASVAQGGLRTVAASGPRSAWALGAPQPDGSGTAVRWDGAAWRRVAFPAGLTGLDVSAPRGGGGAWAAAQDYGTYAAAVLHYEDGAWVRKDVPAERLALLSISARSDHDVWLGGMDTSTDTPFIYHWDGGTWTEAQIQKPNWGAIKRIVAVAPDDVWAYRTDLILGVEHTLLHWDGTSWTEIPVPESTGAYAGLTPDGHGGVWMSAASAQGSSLYLHYSGGQWTTVRGPDRGTGYVGINDIERLPGRGTVLSIGYTSSGPLAEALR
jgi:hypothetical protein